MEPKLTNSCKLFLFLLNLRMEIEVPSNAIGAITTFKRLPSGNRESTNGLLSSIRRPTRATKRFAMSVNCSLLINLLSVFSRIPARSTQISLGPLTKISFIVSSDINSRSGP